MKEFYIVTAWHNFYPSGGVENIKLVTTSKEEADTRAVLLRSSFKKVEISSSLELPWSTSFNLNTIEEEV